MERAALNLLICLHRPRPSPVASVTSALPVLLVRSRPRPELGSGDSSLTHGRGALTVEQRDQLVTPDADSGVRVDPPSR